MRNHEKRRFRPHLESIENRNLLSTLAVVDIQNQSTYDITFDFRWAPSSAWVSYSETPGQSELLWTGYSTLLAPQVLVNTTTHAGSETTYSLSQGFGEWVGTGSPPASAATNYAFQNTTNGIGLTYSPPMPVDAVVSVANLSSSSPTFGFRWSSSSPWTLYTEKPGQVETFSTAYATNLAPQVLYDTTSSSSSQVDYDLPQGYSPWNESGTPPASAATPYAFTNTRTGIGLVYAGPATNLSEITGAHWSGYVAETNFADPQPGSVTAVNGSWVVPVVSGPPTGSTNASIWVGIDGNGNSTVEQIGTSEKVVDGQPIYYAWWEMYSTIAQQPEQPIYSMTIVPGDSISASVQYMTTGPYRGLFDLSIVDNSRPDDSFNTYASSPVYQNPLAQLSTAEWIVEAPESAATGSVEPLANFGQVTFTNATAVIDGRPGPINSIYWQSKAENIGGNGLAGDSTSLLTNLGTSFVVTYNPSAGAAVLGGASGGSGTGSFAALGTPPRPVQTITVTPFRRSTSPRLPVSGSFRPTVRPHRLAPQGLAIDRFPK